MQVFLLAMQTDTMFYHSTLHVNLLLLLLLSNVYLAGSKNSNSSHNDDINATKSRERVLLFRDINTSNFMRIFHFACRFLQANFLCKIFSTFILHNDNDNRPTSVIVSRSRYHLHVLLWLDLRLRLRNNYICYQDRRSCSISRLRGLPTSTDRP